MQIEASSKFNEVGSIKLKANVFENKNKIKQKTNINTK
jgi:hypothetical protein